jgi:hypothetical protein
MPMGIRLLGAAVLVAALAAGNAVRATCWTQTDGFLCGPLASRPVAAAIAPIAVAGLTRAEIAAPEWRPLTLTLQVAGPGAVRISERPDGPGVVVDGGHAASLVVQGAPTPTSSVQLWAEPAPGSSTPAVVQVTALAPVLAPGRLVVALAAGAAAAAALAWALLFRFGGRAAGDGSAIAAATDRPAAWLAPVALLVVVHGAWVLLKPPLQSPDEPQHHARATSAPRTPYVAGSRTVTVAAAHRNPLTWTPNRLHAIIFQPPERLSDAEVRALRHTPWPPPGTYPATETLFSPIASYPPVYYWLVFAGGELATWLLGLGPYTSLLAYRVASALIAGGIWLAVYREMRRTPDLRPWSLPAFVVLIANPTTASLTSSVNPDAVVIPATALLLLATWRRLTAGGGATAIVASAVLALAVKPSGMLATASAGAAVLWWMWRQPATRAAGVGILRLLVFVSVAAQVVFYAWSPPRLITDTSRASDSLREFAGTLVGRAPSWWVEYWGRLGWLEYAAPPGWYWLLLGTCVALVAMACWRPIPDARLGSFLLVAGLGYAGLLVASEYLHLATAPLFIQGRYLLPVSICLVPIVRHRTPALAWALPVLLVGLNVALAQATVARYFAGGWASWFASLV